MRFLSLGMFFVNAILASVSVTEADYGLGTLCAFGALLMLFHHDREMRT